MRGVALAPDTRGHVRKKLSQGVMRGILAAKVEEIVREVVRGVRTPVREEEVRIKAGASLLCYARTNHVPFRLHDSPVYLPRENKNINRYRSAGS